MRRKILSVLLVVCLCFSMSGTTVWAVEPDGSTMPLADNEKYSGGEGTKDNPYRISTAKDMWDLAGNSEDWNKCFDVTEDINLSEGSYKGINWSPIGEAGNGTKFTGTFDGKGHWISGLYIYINRSGQGLFGYTKDCTISNLNVEGQITSGGYTGGIVGYFDIKDVPSSRIDNCTFKGSIDGIPIDGSESDSSGTAVGGIVGYNHGGTVINCRYSGIITRKTQYVGGIVGQNDGNSAIIENCFNEGTIIIEGNAHSAGGIVGIGISGSQIISCYNSGEVYGTGSKGRIGGIVGDNKGKEIIKCYNVANVSGTNQIGGVVGQNENSSNVTNCYNTAMVTGDSDVGGVVGRNVSNDSTISKETAGSIDVGKLERSYNRGNVIGTTNVGGIVGCNTAKTKNGTYTKNGTVNNCYYLNGVANGGIAGSDVDDQAEAKSENQFKSGEVTWLLQHGQDNLVWGQELVIPNPDLDVWPMLVNNVDYQRTNKTDVPRVIKVTFSTNSEPEVKVSYTNVGGKATLPTNTPDPDPKHNFYQWSVGSAKGRNFADDTTIKQEDVVVDEVTIVAAQREYYAGEEGYIEANGTYSKSKKTVPLDLDNYMSYEAGSSTVGKFTYTITNKEELPGAELTDGGITVPGNTPVGSYHLTIHAKENEPLVSTYSLGKYDTKGLDLNVVINIGKATPEVNPTTNAITYHQNLGDSNLSGTATYEGNKVEGDWTWEDESIPPAVSDSNSTEYNYTFTPTGADAENYENVKGTKTVTVNKAKPELTAPKAKEGIEYSGNTQDLITKGTVEGGEIQYSTDGITYSTTIPSFANAGDYQVWYKVVGDLNHENIEPKSFTVTIDKAPLTIEEQDITYNGSNEFTATVEGKVDQNVIVTLKMGSENAGDYTYGPGSNGYTAIIAKPQDDNYKIVGGKTQTIKKALAIIKWTSDLTFTFDDDEHEVTAEVANPVRDTDKFVISYIDKGNLTNKGTNPGSYTAIVSDINNVNYVIDKETSSQAWRINKAGSIVTLTADNSIVYGDTLTLTATVTSDAAIGNDDKVEIYINNSVEPFESIELNGKNEVTFYVHVNSANGLSVGSNKFRADYTGNANVEGGKSSAISVGVTPREIKANIINTDESKTKTYDGNNYAIGLILDLKGVLSCDNDVIVTADNFTYESKNVQYDSEKKVTNNTITANGVAISGPKSGNYTLSKEAVTTTGKIEPKEVGLSWNNLEKLVYNGQPQMAVATINGLVSNDDKVGVAVEISGKDQNCRNAGRYVAMASLTGSDSGNYVLPYEKTKDYTIGKAPLTITARSFTYTGEKDFHVELNGVTLDNDEIEKVALTLTTNEANVGEYQYSNTKDKDKYTAAFNDSVQANNYEITGETITIEKADWKDFELKPVIRTYSGKDQELIEKDSIMSEGIEYSFDMTGDYSEDVPKATKVGKYQIWYRVGKDPNHNELAPKSVTAEILPVEIDITKQTFTYNGGTSFSIDIDGVSSEVVKASFTTSSPNVGVYQANAGKESRAVDDEMRYDVFLSSSNYIVDEEQELEIVPKELNLRWVGYEDLVYTGEPVFVSALADGLIDGDECEIIVENGDRINAGKYTATVTGLTGKDSRSYTISSDNEQEYTIEPAELKVAEQTFKYSGKDTFTVEVEGINGDKVTVTLNASSADAGKYNFGDGEKTYTAIPKNTNYKVVSGGTLTIEKVDPTYTPPTAKDLVYNRNSQELVKKGSAIGGEMQYSLFKDGPYSTEIPTGIEEGNYIVWYRIVGDANHNDVAPQSVEVKIVAKVTNNPTDPTDPDTPNKPSDLNHPTQPDQPEKTPQNPNETIDSTQGVHNGPQTSDKNTISIFVYMTCLSGLAIMLLLRKKHREEK